MKKTDFEILPVGDQGVMLRFGDKVCDETHAKVLAADNAVQALNPKGLTETIPSFASLFVGYDPLEIDAETFGFQLNNMSIQSGGFKKSEQVWDVPVCFDADFSPDLTAVAEATGLTRDAVIKAHLSGDYRVYMYGFAPGYAYMGGVPGSIQLPRKSDPVRDVPAGSVLVAGPQCLVTTLTMPTGWWIIGRSPFSILRPEAENPFPIEVGQSIRFHRVSRDFYDAYELGNAHDR